MCALCLFHEDITFQTLNCLRITWVAYRNAALEVPDSVMYEMGTENSYLSQIAEGFATAGLGS